MKNTSIAVKRLDSIFKIMYSNYLNMSNINKDNFLYFYGFFDELNIVIDEISQLIVQYKRIEIVPQFFIQKTIKFCNSFVQSIDILERYHCKFNNEIYDITNYPDCNDPEDKIYNLKNINEFNLESDYIEYNGKIISNIKDKHFRISNEIEQEQKSLINILSNENVLANIKSHSLFNLTIASSG